MNDWSPIAKEYNPLKAGSIDGTDVDPHDRAVFRAMLARYKPNKGVLGDPLMTLFVARINPLTTEDKLHEVFSKFGDIQRLRLVRDIVTGFSKGYAFVEYKEERSVFRAWRDGNKLVVDQHEVFVDMEQERTLKGWVPRRLGGGLGGKKESGQLRFGGRDRPFRKPITLGGVGPDRGQDWGHDRGSGGWRDWDRPGPRDGFDRDRRRDSDRESRDIRGDRESRDTRGDRDRREDRGSRDSRGDREGRDSRGDREGRDNRGDRESRDNRGDRESRDNRGDRESRDNRGDRESRDNRGDRENRDIRGDRESRDREGRDTRGDRDRDRSRHRERR